MESNMKYIVDMNLEVVETTALNVERSNSTNSNLSNTLFIAVAGKNYHKNYRNTDVKLFLWC